MSATTTSAATTPWRLVNQTPWPIWVEGDGGRVLTLAPLEDRTEHWDGDPRDELPLQRLVDRHQLLVLPAEVGGGGGGGVRATARQLRHRLHHSITMLLVVAVAVVLPGAAIYWGTGLAEQVRLDGGRLVVAQPLELIGRLLQLTLISVASMLPALMFFQFDAERLVTLRNRWMQNAFRLDPSLSTLADVEAKYGAQIQEAYGRPTDGEGRLWRGRRSPLVVATVVLTFGWLLILLNADDRVVPTTGDGVLSFAGLLDPAPTVVTFAFLGAYFFALSLVLRAFVRGDLRPKTYNAVTARVLLVVILAWLLSVVWPEVADEQWLYAVAFLSGFVPETTVHLLGEWVDAVDRHLPTGGGRYSTRLGSDNELTDLDGIDLYERTRLADEGINNVQALAHHDLVDLFFKTRIPAARLVDWVDQAVLHLHLCESGHPASSEPTPVQRLRALSVRTATGLLQESEEQEDPACARRRALIAEAVSPGEDDPARALDRLRLLERSLQQGEWVWRIRHWRSSDLVAVGACQRKYVDAAGVLQPGDPRFITDRLSEEERRLVAVTTTRRTSADVTEDLVPGSTTTTTVGALAIDDEVDLGDLAAVPEELWEDADAPDDNGLGETGAELLDDVPEGEPGWVDPEGDLVMDLRDEPEAVQP